ncbi:hypothetical protein [Belnapia rosea]|uniref:Uncharacterized protein n=1 Tax=Belnapia rosea TaxID=938405 RepID=A0A1G6ZI04_9PROT|nr:hypothetical protein [Belnapia rosea]SDE01897.1 hypothetical protein SAMN04487779_1016100 [Belnapia rosea]
MFRFHRACNKRRDRTGVVILAIKASGGSYAMNDLILTKNNDTLMITWLGLSARFELGHSGSILRDAVRFRPVIEVLCDWMARNGSRGASPRETHTTAELLNILSTGLHQVSYANSGFRQDAGRTDDSIPKLHLRDMG